MIKSVGLIQPSVNDRGYGNARNGGDDLTKKKKLSDSYNGVPHHISKVRSKRSSDSSTTNHTKLDRYRNR